MFFKCHAPDGTEVFLNPQNITYLKYFAELEGEEINATQINFNNDEPIDVKETPQYIITQSKICAGLNINGIGISRVTVFTDPAPALENNVTE